VGRGGSAAAAGNALDVLIEGAAYFPALEQEIRGAHVAPGLLPVWWILASQVG
jgi:hypothetical protein